MQREPNMQKDETAMQSALSDVTVLDLSRVLAGPYGTMVLGDLGARIIKIEQPGQGDETRQWGPPFTPGGQSAYFVSVNRNKQSVTLNLKHEAGKDLLRRLVAQADVLIENFKVGTMQRLGLGYDALRAINPGLIYCAITGYGQDGPYRDRPGYDTVIQAQGGIMSINGPSQDGQDGEPFKVGVAIVDVSAGLFAATGILAALHHRHRTGQGQFIDVALFDAQLGWLVNVGSSYLVSGNPPRRYANAHSTIVPYQPFPTQDGHVMVAVGNDRQFTAFCQALDAAHLAQDPRFATNPERVRHRDTLLPLLSQILAQQPTHHWIEALLERNVPCGPVNDIPSALGDPQAQARQMVQEVTDANGDTFPLVGPVIKMDRTPLTVHKAPPLLGEDTAAVLSQTLGLSPEQINNLATEGVV